MNIKNAILVVFIIWSISLGAYFFPDSSPIEFYGGTDSVTPTQVLPGGIINVKRTFRILRTAEIHVSRQMIKGDCNIACEIVDLPPTHKVYNVGDYAGLGRDHQIPVSIHPGLWRLTFTFTWKTKFGAQRHVLAPVLEVEVLPPQSIKVI